MLHSVPLSVNERLERIKDVAADLSRELVRKYTHSPSALAMAKQLSDDAAAVLLALKERQR